MRFEHIPDSHGLVPDEQVTEVHVAGAVNRKVRATAAVVLAQFGPSPQQFMYDVLEFAYMDAWIISLQPEIKNADQEVRVQIGRYPGLFGNSGKEREAQESMVDEELKYGSSGFSVLLS